MNKINVCRLFLHVILLAIGLNSCISVEFEDEETNTSLSNIKVITRSSAESHIDYPISVYAFAEDGTMKGYKKIESADESLSFALPEGKYNLVAFSNYSDYTFSSTPNYGDLVSMPESNYSDYPLMRGSAFVNLGSSSQSVNILLSYIVSDVIFNLSNVPASVNQVQLTLSSLYNKLGFNGDYSGSETVHVNCTKKDNLWTSDHFYVFGSSSPNLSVSISLVGSDATNTYGYVYNEKLLPGIPYQMNGSYQDGLAINGAFHSGEWAENIVANFTFGPGNEEHLPEYEVSTIPFSNSVWNGHVVVKTAYTSNTEADLTLISLNEWSGLTSAYHATKPNDAANAAMNYSEAGLTDWHIPSKEEASYLKSIYSGDQLSALSNMLESAGGVPVMDEDDSGTNIRYLCENATQTFVFKAGSSLSKAGATVSSYRLRLLKTVHVKEK